MSVSARRMAVLATLGVLFAACTGRTGLPTPTSTAGLRPGWRSIGYGALTVGVPPGWRVVPSATIRPCAFPPTRSIAVGTISHVSTYSCPAIPSGTGDSFVSLTCLTGAAVADIYSASAPTTLVGRVVMQSGWFGLELTPALQ